MTMSRIVVAAAALCLAIPVAPGTADTLETYQKLTSVEPRCVRPTSSQEIIVCGARRADRWRVPYVGYDAGDPRGESIEGERKRVSAAPKVPCGQGAIIADCGGGVGVKYTTNFTSQGERLRPLAK